MMLLADLFYFCIAQSTTEYGLILSVFSAYTVCILRIWTRSTLRIQYSFILCRAGFEILLKKYNFNNNNDFNNQ